MNYKLSLSAVVGLLTLTSALAFAGEGGGVRNGGGMTFNRPDPVEPRTAALPTEIVRIEYGTRGGGQFVYSIVPRSDSSFEIKTVSCSGYQGWKLSPQDQAATAWSILPETPEFAFLVKLFASEVEINKGSPSQIPTGTSFGLEVFPSTSTAEAHAKVSSTYYYEPSVHVDGVNRLDVLIRIESDARKKSAALCKD